jgi:hypothetical protein
MTPMKRPDDTGRKLPKWCYVLNILTNTGYACNMAHRGCRWPSAAFVVLAAYFVVALDLRLMFERQDRMAGELDMEDRS